MCALPAEQPIANQSQSVWALHLAAGMCRRSIEYQGGVEGNLHQGGLVGVDIEEPWENTLDEAGCCTTREHALQRRLQSHGSQDCLRFGCRDFSHPLQHDRGKLQQRLQSSKLDQISKVQSVVGPVPDSRHANRARQAAVQACTRLAAQSKCSRSLSPSLPLSLSLPFSFFPHGRPWRASRAQARVVRAKLRHGSAMINITVDDRGASDLIGTCCGLEEFQQRITALGEPGSGHGEQHRRTVHRSLYIVVEPMIDKPKLSILCPEALPFLGYGRTHGRSSGFDSGLSDQCEPFLASLNLGAAQG